MFTLGTRSFRKIYMHLHAKLFFFSLLSVFYYLFLLHNQTSKQQTHTHRNLNVIEKGNLAPILTTLQLHTILRRSAKATTVGWPQLYTKLLNNLLIHLFSLLEVNFIWFFWGFRFWILPFFMAVFLLALTFFSFYSVTIWIRDVDSGFTWIFIFISFLKFVIKSLEFCH